MRIITDSDVLTKGRAWWRLPKFPAHIAITLGPRIAIDNSKDTKAWTAEIETWFRSPSPVDTACAAQRRPVA